MPIKYELRERINFEDWLDKNNITVVVKERIWKPGQVRPKRYYATTTELIEIKEDMFLKTTHGNGDNPLEAIEDLKREWQGKLLVRNAMHPDNREEIQTPNEWS